MPSRVRMSTLALCATAVVLAGCNSHTTGASGVLPAQGKPVDKAKPVHLGAAAPCPAAAPEFVTNDVAGLRARLVPLMLSGQSISGALVCVWDGLNATPPLGLRATTELTASAAQTLAEDFDALPPGLTGMTNCPADDGSAALVVFAYGTAGYIDALVRPTGCRSVTNGAGYTNGAPGVGVLLNPGS